MPIIDDNLPTQLQKTLTSLGEQLFWDEEDYTEAREVVTERAIDAGLKKIDVSDNRLVIQIPEDRLPDYDEPLAAKLPQRQSPYPGGIKQNVEEIDLYRNGPDWLREYLIPVEAAHTRGFWLVMRYAPKSDSSSIEERQQELLEHGIVTNEILAPQNWGEWQGDVYLTDYGLNISEHFPDVEVRNYVDIVDEEDRRRGLIPNETTGNSEEIEEEEIPDIPVAERVVASAGIIPDLKSDIREKLLNEVIQSGDEIDVELEDRVVTVEIERTEPRSDRSMQDEEFQIGENTRISL